MSTAVDRRERTRRGSGTNLALFLAGLATFAAMYSVQALLPALTADFGASPAVAALAVSATTGALALAVVPVSLTSERFGRTRVMVLSAILAAVLGVLLPLCPNLPLLLIGRTLQGAALAGVPAVAMAYLAEEVEGSGLGTAMGRYVAGTTIGGLAGRVLAGLAVDVTAWRWALEITAVLAALAAAGFVATLPPSANFVPRRIRPLGELRGLLAHLRSPVLGTLFLLAFLLMGGFVSVYNYLGYRLAAPPFSLPESVIGLVFLLYLAGTVSSAAAGRLADRFGRGRVLGWCLAGTVVGLAVTLAGETAVVLAGVLLFTAGFFGAHSVASGWVGAAAVVQRAGASALYLLAYYAGSAVIGSASGLAFAAFGWTGLVAAVGSLLVAAGLAAALALRGS